MVLLAHAPRPDFAGCIKILRDLPDLLQAQQRRLGLTNTVVARQIGIAQSTLTGIYRGSSPNLPTILACLTWLSS